MDPGLSTHWLYGRRSRNQAIRRVGASHGSTLSAAVGVANALRVCRIVGFATFIVTYTGSYRFLYSVSMAGVRTRTGKLGIRIHLEVCSYRFDSGRLSAREFIIGAIQCFKGISDRLCGEHLHTVKYTNSSSGKEGCNLQARWNIHPASVRTEKVHG